MMHGTDREDPERILDQHGLDQTGPDQNAKQFLAVSRPPRAADDHDHDHDHRHHHHHHEHAAWTKWS